MLCDPRRAKFFRFGWAILQTIPLAVLLAAAGPARSQQGPDRPTAGPPQANPIDRWNRMSPEERERELAKLPPARARAIRQRIWRYNHMRPEEQQALRQRYQTFSQLPPDKQQVVRQRLREFHQLPPGRQPQVHREVVQLRSLPEGQRQARMNSDEFRGRFSPQERQIIRDLSAYFPN
jgi:hypothetical protein